jgi:hypothetical protein
MKRLLPIGRDHLAAVFIEGTPQGPTVFKSDTGLVEGIEQLIIVTHG